MENRIRGRRIHFAGSADSNINPTKLMDFHSLVKALAKRIVLDGGGLVVTVGTEPKHEHDSDLPIIFDWTLLEAFQEQQNDSDSNWPRTLGLPVVAVGLPRWKDKIPDNRKSLWRNLVDSGCIELVQIKSGLSIGGVLREKQASFGDILVVAGGGPGVDHLADLYISNRKPVIPLDIQLKTEEQGAAKCLAVKAIENPHRFFDYELKDQAAADYSMISIRENLPNGDEFAERVINFINNICKPKVFYVRLLNEKHEDFKAVEGFFRDVVDPFVEEAGFQRFEMMKDTIQEPFLNVEIFKALKASSLVLIDLTSMRPNCLIELGYALGLGKKVIITALENTRLPFDTAALPCYFWPVEKQPDQLRESFKEFIRINIDRKPVNTVDI